MVQVSPPCSRQELPRAEPAVPGRGVCAARASPVPFPGESGLAAPAGPGKAHVGAAVGLEKRPLRAGQPRTRLYLSWKPLEMGNTWQGRFISAPATPRCPKRCWGVQMAAGGFRGISGATGRLRGWGGWAGPAVFPGICSASSSSQPGTRSLLFLGQGKEERGAWSVRGAGRFVGEGWGQLGKGWDRAPHWPLLPWYCWRSYF